MGDVRPSRSAWADAARYADLGLRFVVATVGGTFGGLWLDRKLEWFGRFPLLTLVGFFLGLLVGMVALFRGVSPARKPDATRADEDLPE